MTRQATPIAFAEYRRRGWTITGHGHIGTASVVGDCAYCHTPTVRYGPHGQPLCRDCRQESAL